MDHYSVLMSVYQNDTPKHLRAALNSMIVQTVQTNDFVLVCDGPLPQELDRVIDEVYAQYPQLFHIIRLEQNTGLGNALAIGLKNCKNELIARMDSDDISVPDRIEKQLSIFESKPYVGLVSGQIQEFDDRTGEIVAIREVPIAHKDIVKRAKHRCPVNHVACMYQKSEVMKAGNYRRISHEDYDLWVRMLQNGTIFENHPDILVEVRTGKSMYGRRGGIQYFKGARQLEKRMLNTGFITKCQYICNVFERFVGALVPSSIRSLLYKLFMRKLPRGEKEYVDIR